MAMMLSSNITISEGLSNRKPNLFRILFAALSGPRAEGPGTGRERGPDTAMRGPSGPKQR